MKAFLAALTCLVWTSAAFAGDVGVILMHGKWGSPSQMRDMGDALTEAGYKVVRPEMTWAGNRLYDATAEQAVAELDKAVDQLRAEGATRFVVAGQSLGAAGAAAAAAAKPDVWAGVVLIAPGHYPEGSFTQTKAGDSIAKAQAMVDAGKGGERDSFLSLNDGDRTKMIEASAEAYLSFYGRQSPMAMSRNVQNLPPVPILWIAPKFDKLTQVFEKIVLPRVPATAKLERVDVNSGHGDAPKAAIAPLLAWLKNLP